MKLMKRLSKIKLQIKLILPKIHRRKVEVREKKKRRSHSHSCSFKQLMRMICKCSRIRNLILQKRKRYPRKKRQLMNLQKNMNGKYQRPNNCLKKKKRKPKLILKANKTNNSNSNSTFMKLVIDSQLKLKLNPHQSSNKSKEDMSLKKKMKISIKEVQIKTIIKDILRSQQVLKYLRASRVIQTMQNSSSRLITASMIIRLITSILALQ